MIISPLNSFTISRTRYKIKFCHAHLHFFYLTKIFYLQSFRHNCAEKPARNLLICFRVYIIRLSTCQAYVLFPLHLFLRYKRCAYCHVFRVYSRFHITHLKTYTQHRFFNVSVRECIFLAFWGCKKFLAKFDLAFRNNV